MGFHNPNVPWKEFERTLSGRPESAPRPDPTVLAAKVDARREAPSSRKRGPYRRPPELTPAVDEVVVPYAELHAHSNYSFLDGASGPEQLVEEAHRLRLNALALTDHDGFYGVVRFAEAAESFPTLGTVFGAELSLGLPEPQHGEADPVGSHLLVLARRQEGYHRLAAAITAGQLAGGEKGRPVYDLEQLAEQAQGDWVVLTGCRKGTVRQALSGGGSAVEQMEAAAHELDRLTALFGRDHVVVELTDHGHPGDQPMNERLAALATAHHLPTVATNAVHYATPAEYQLASAVAAVRARRSLDELDGWLPATDGLHLRSGAEMARTFARYPGAVARSVEIADEVQFKLRSVKPNLPKQEVPAGHTPISWLRELVWRGASERYPDGHGGIDPASKARLERELTVIEEKDFPGYFLIVHDIVSEARRRGILCQGRGSAANSAVCFVLAITAVDSIFYDLPFERFLSALRDEAPDIDVDFDSDRREEIIQYVYAKYGRFNAAQVANVITYRPRGAIRDMAKALGYSTGQQDAWAKQVERWGGTVGPGDHTIPEPVIELAQRVLTFPRHLGIHSGGMVLTDRPIGEVCPIEHARMERRTVLQWDKDDCAWMGLVKFDLLGLGMLAAIQYTFDLVREATGEAWELATIPKEEPAVYDMLCRADSVGVFQVESRAQIGTLPRLKPRSFYDLVVEIALIRPGPVQGGAVHPYLRRRAGEEPVTYLHPRLEPVLKRTLGIPLFQEQLMQMAVAVGDCTSADADLLRRAMGSKRGIEKVERLRDTLYAGMARNGLTPEESDAIYNKIEAFANFGFAESHSLSFALLVYASSWLKLHYPAAFHASLLRAQPMGFYSPQSLTADARRHGVKMLRPDLLRSGVHATLERLNGAPTAGLDGCLNRTQPPIPEFDRSAPDVGAAHRRDAAFAVRLGLTDVAGIGTELAERIVAERDARGPYRDMPDLARRIGVTTVQLEALSAAGAFETFGLDRRSALWQAGEAALDRPEYLPGTVVSVQPPLLPLLSPAEQTIYDLWATGISPDDHPMAHLRGALDVRRVVRIDRLHAIEPGTRIEVGGVVTHRQRPGTASGITFLNLEDESGTLNVIAGVGVWKRYRLVARGAPAMIIRGILERTKDGVTNLIADQFESLAVSAPGRSRDFR